MRISLIILALALVVSGTVSGQTYTINTVAGGGPSEPIPALSAGLGLVVSGVATDAQGNVYLALRDHHVIMRLDSTGMLTRIAGTGAAGYSGDNGPATYAQLRNPWGIALDSAGSLYIADSEYCRIRKVSNGVITTVAGDGSQGYSGDNGPAISAQLHFPIGIAVDSAGDLYIADSSNHRIRKVSNGVITTVAGNGTEAYSGDGGPATSAGVNWPRGVAVDSAGNLYIADYYNLRIRKVSNGVITTVAGNGTPGYGGDNGPAPSAQLRSPEGVAVDSAGNLYIADGPRLRRVSNGVITTVAGNGTEGYSGDNGPATSAQLDWPVGAAVDSAGSLYIADGPRLRKVSSGMITTVAGNGTVGYSGDNGPATSAQLNRPEGVGVDSASDLYVADTQNNRIRKVSNGVITTVAGGGTAAGIGDNGPATSARLSSPYGVAVDSSGNLYIADSSNNRIRKVSNGVISTIAGNGTQGFGGYGGDNGPAISAQLSSPRGVAVDSTGNLYIADHDNQRIRKVSNGVITTVAGDGTQEYGGDNGPATSAQLNNPAGVAVDSAGNLYIADSYNNRIRKVSNGVITTVAGGGTTGDIGTNGPATSARLFGPDGVAVDSAGNLYIADSDSNSIRKVSNGVITTVAGNGTHGYSGDGGPATSAKLDYPTGVAADSAGNLYIADNFNHRIRKLSSGGSAPLATVSAASFTPSVPLAPGVIAAGYGTNLVSTIEIAPATGPLPTVLAQTSVKVRDSAGVERTAPLWFVSPSQINYYIPDETALGLATMTVVRNSLTIASGTLQIERVAPGLFTMNANGQGVPAALAIFAKGDGSQSWQYVFNTGCQVGSCQPVPLDLGAATDQVFLQLYGTGIRGRSALAAVTAKIGGVDAPVDYAGPVSGMIGLDQVNLRVPRSLIGRGEVDVVLTVDGKPANAVQVNIK